LKRVSHGVIGKEANKTKKNLRVGGGLLIYLSYAEMSPPAVQLGLLTH
jgi:hypothetical protein